MLQSLLLFLAALTAPPPLWDLPTLLAHAPLVAVAEIADPRLDVEDIALPKAVAAPRVFQRMRRVMTVVAMLRGHLHGQIRVDEPAWRDQLRRAQRGEAPLPVPVFAGHLSREPVPGTRVLVFLRRTSHGDVELAAGEAMAPLTLEPDVRAGVAAARRRR